MPLELPSSRRNGVAEEASGAATRAPLPAREEEGGGNGQHYSSSEASQQANGAGSSMATESVYSPAREAVATSNEYTSEKSASPIFKINGASGRQRGSKGRRDSFSSLSAMGAETLYAESDHQSHGKRRLPLLLTVFVCIVAGICGLVVSGVHYTLLYSGCPLGVNGCNEFHHKEDKGFILTRWLRDVAGEQVPESVVYIVVATAGAVLFAQLATRLPNQYLFEISGGGTLQALVAVASGECIPLPAALLRVVTTSLYLGSGGTLGGEGPAIQVCTSVAMFVGWIAGIQATSTQSLLACIGISCGFAASFNSPLAGILFAMEELQHISPSLSKTLICCILVASVVATATVRATHGNTQIFKVEWQEKSESSDPLFGPGLWMFIAVPIGLLCSFVAALITLSVRWLNRTAQNQLRSWPYTLLFGTQAVVAAAIGAAVFHSTGLRGVWGIGAGSLQEAFNADESLKAWKYIVFALGKVAAMVLAVSLRAPGDVLEPVLISGGFLGGFVGRIICLVLEVPDKDIMTPCIIFGMVALFAACFRFPLTPVVIVLELTGIGSYSIILPTALASFTAITASSRLCRPILDEIMHEDGIDLQEMAREVHEQRDCEIWFDPTVEEGGCKPSEAAIGTLPHPDTATRERRPSRCFLDMEELLNECVSDTVAAALTPPRTSSRSHSKSSHDGDAPLPPLPGPLGQRGVPRFRERSNSVGSARSHSKCSTPGDGLPGPLRVQQRQRRERSNSIGSARSLGSHQTPDIPYEAQLKEAQPREAGAHRRPRSNSLGSGSSAANAAANVAASATASAAASTTVGKASAEPQDAVLRL